MRRNFLFWAMIGVLASFPALAGETPARIAGVWKTPGGAAKIDVGPCETSPTRICGVLKFLANGRDSAGELRRDSANPNARLRERRLIGIRILEGFRSSGPGKWSEGTIYDPESGRTYVSRIALGRKGELIVSGCVLVVCRSQTWTRAE